MQNSGFDENKVVEQVDAFKKVQHIYTAYSKIIEGLLKAAAKKMGISAIVSSRVKGILNFAEKIIRKKKLYKDPVNQLTDLCGARVIVNNQDDILPVCDFIRDNFDIDEANSEDVVDRLGESKFGYRSVHFIVSLKSELKDSLLLPVSRAAGIDISETMLDTLLEHWRNDASTKDDVYHGPRFKAEIQVRTLIQHAWAESAHDQIYKNDFNMPESLKRDSNRTAAILEAADASFAKTSRDVAAYQTYYGAYMDPEKMKNEIQKLEAIFQFDETNKRLAGQIARMAIIIEDWERAVKILEKPVSDWIASDHAEKMMDYLHVLEETKDESDTEKLENINQGLPRHKDPFIAGLLHDYAWAGWCFGGDDQFFTYLKLSSLLDQTNTDILNSVAIVYKNKNDLKRALKSYLTAFKINAGKPRALAGLIYCKSLIEHDLEFAKIMTSNLNQCIETCRKRADVKVFLPDAFYYMGFFYLASEQPYKSLNAYAKAVDLSITALRLQQELDTIRKIKTVCTAEDRIRFEWVEAFLVAAIYIKQSKAGDDTGQVRKELLQIAAIGHGDEYDAESNVVIVAGGCDKKVEKKINEYRSLLEKGFSCFSGVIFAGGTEDGISGLVGDLEPGEGCHMIKIAYLPKFIPSGTKCHGSYQYKATSSMGFTPLECIYSWIDLLLHGKNPDEVRLVGINGGQIAGFEYRMALAFGAQVGIISDSGRAAHDVLTDPDWCTHKKLLALPNDPMTLRFLIQRHDTPDFLTVKDKERLAKMAHEKYLEEKQEKEIKDPSILPWDKLPHTLKRSNLDQIDYIQEKLLAVGLSIRKIKPGKKTIFKRFSDVHEAQVLKMAEMEHARWNIERLKDGWVLGEKDASKKRSPYIIPWLELTDEVKKWDIDTIHAIPELLGAVGYEIVEIKEERYDTA